MAQYSCSTLLGSAMATNETLGVPWGSGAGKLGSSFSQTFLHAVHAVSWLKANDSRHKASYIKNDRAENAWYLFHCACCVSVAACLTNDDHPTESEWIITSISNLRLPVYL